MKFTTILAMPFALAADVVTLGRGFNRSFVGEIIDNDRREAEARIVADGLARIAQANADRAKAEASS